MNSGILLWKGRGLDIKNDLLPRVKPITQFLRGNAQHELKDELKTRLIATVRVHVERAIARTKKKQIILQSKFQLSMSLNLNKIWVICSYLVNFLSPFTAQKNWSRKVPLKVFCKNGSLEI